MEDDTHNRHWLSSALESRVATLFSNRLVASILIFGSLPWIYDIALFVLRSESTSLWVKMGYAGVSAWLSVGPYLVWRWHRNTIPDFFSNLSSVINDKKCLEETRSWFQRNFQLCSLISSTIWAIISIVIWTLTTKHSDAIGIGSLGDPLYVIGCVIAAWGGVVGGIGFCGVLVMVWVILKLAKSPFTVDPLHHDGRGGITCFGDCAVETTLLFGTGVLFIPFILAVIAQSKEMHLYVWLVLVAWASLILMSFFVPIVAVSRTAKRARDAAITAIGNQYRGLMDATSGKSQARDDMMQKYLRLEHLRWEFSEYKHISVYPVNTKILASLFLQAFLPIMIFLLRHVVTFL